MRIREVASENGRGANLRLLSCYEVGCDPLRNPQLQQPLHSIFMKSNTEGKKI